MSMKQWSPTPWFTVKDEFDEYVNVSAQTGGMIFERACASDSAARLNARLAAAAPTLYDALEAAIVALRVALSRHENAIAMARADGAYVPEEFGEREADVFRIAIRDATAALAAAQAPQ